MCFSWMIGVVIVICPDVISTARPNGRSSILVWSSCLLRVGVRYVIGVLGTCFIHDLPIFTGFMLVGVATGGMGLVLVITLE